MKKWNVVLRLASQSISDKIVFARYIVSSMTNNDYFPNPTPALSTITQIADELQLAYEQSRDGSKLQTAIMHSIATKLDMQLKVLGNYVLAIANRDNDIGAAIIYSAGMEIKQENGGRSTAFTVANTIMDGLVKLYTKSKGRVSYVWEYSLDEETWTLASITIQANTIIKGLTPGKRYYFRVASIAKIQSPWLGPINTIVT